MPMNKLITAATGLAILLSTGFANANITLAAGDTSGYSAFDLAYKLSYYTDDQGDSSTDGMNIPSVYASDLSTLLQGTGINDDLQAAVAYGWSDTPEMTFTFHGDNGKTLTCDLRTALADPKVTMTVLIPNATNCK